MIVTVTQKSRASPLLTLFRAFFCYVEPCMAVSGALLASFTPESFLNSILPPSPGPSSTTTTIEATPLVKYLLVIIAGLYCMLATVQVFLLGARQHDSGVWRVVMLGMLAGDIVHLGAIQIAVPGSSDIYWKVWTWRVEDWANIGLLLLCVALRLAYLLWSVAEDRRRRRTSPSTALPVKS
jgi:hypothetical protein